MDPTISTETNNTPNVDISELCNIIEVNNSTVENTSDLNETNIDVIADGFLNVLDNKKQELENIQTDLNDLMDRLSNFISDSQDFYDSDEDEGHDENHNMNSFGDYIPVENQKDSGNEKPVNIPIEEFYVTDGNNPPEINWDTLAPYIQGIVGDLQKLRNLNVMTNSVMSRIRNVTEDIHLIEAEEANIEEVVEIENELENNGTTEENLEI